MMLREDQWVRIEPLLSGKAGDCGVTGKHNRLFIEAVLWICRTGSPWRDLPSRFGHWHTVYTRYNRWSKKGQWQAILDALGNPVRLILTAGQASEYAQAGHLIEGFDADYVLADKGYDSDQFIETVQATSATAVIPPRKNRKQQRDYDEEIYKERNLVERLFQKLKQFRRIATRYERLKRNYLSMLNLACSMIWLA